MSSTDVGITGLGLGFIMSLFSVLIEYDVSFIIYYKYGVIHERT